MSVPIRAAVAPAPLLYSVREAAAMLSVSENFVWNLLREGTLLGVKVGRNRRIAAAELERYAASLSETG